MLFSTLDPEALRGRAEALARQDQSGPVGVGEPGVRLRVAGVVELDDEDGRGAVAGHAVERGGPRRGRGRGGRGGGHFEPCLTSI